MATLAVGQRELAAMDEASNATYKLMSQTTQAEAAQEVTREEEEEDGSDVDVNVNVDVEVGLEGGSPTVRMQLHGHDSHDGHDGHDERDGRDGNEEMDGSNEGRMTISLPTEVETCCICYGMSMCLY